MKRKTIYRMVAVLAACMFVVGVAPAVAFAVDDIEITYKTNAGVEMGTVGYALGDPANAFPSRDEFDTQFAAFMGKATQKGSVTLASEGSRWYSDADFTQPASFPSGGGSYTVYCKLTTGLRFDLAQNLAEDKSYSTVQDLLPPFLGASWSCTSARSDQYEATVAVFEKNVDGAWMEVGKDYYTDSQGAEWLNIIWFSNVSDSGTYRLKHLCYTATDNDGNVLYYDFAYELPGTTYAVKINPVELTITGVQALDRTCNGTTEFALTGGVLNGVLFGDDVSFVLGTGSATDKFAGANKPISTNIELSGSKAGNYTLTQPLGITASVTCDPTEVLAREPTCTKDGNIAHWHCSACGKYYRDAAGAVEMTQGETVLKAVGHLETELKGAKEATCTEAGYTGDTVCVACDVVIERGAPIEKRAHRYENGVCAVCGAAEAAAEATGIDTGIPRTGDGGRTLVSIALSAAVCAGIAAAVARKGASRRSE